MFKLEVIKTVPKVVQTVIDEYPTFIEAFDNIKSRKQLDEINGSEPIKYEIIRRSRCESFDARGDCCYEIYVEKEVMDSTLVGTFSNQQDAENFINIFTQDEQKNISIKSRPVSTNTLLPTSNTNNCQIQ